MRPVRTILSIIALILLVAALSHAWSTQPWRPYWTPYVQKGWEGKQWDKNIYASVEDETGATSYRCSMVAGTAFFQAVGVDLSPYVGDLLILTDSTGKQAYGYISAAGGGETLGAAVNSNPTFDVNTTGWGTDNCTIASIAGGQSNNCCELTRTGASTQYAVQTGVNILNGALYYLSGYAKSGTSGNELALVWFHDTIDYRLLLPQTTSGSWVQVSGYATSLNTVGLVVIHKQSATAGTMLFDEVFLKQVTDCAATGVHIVSTPNGSVQSWASITSGFNPNDAAMTFDIYETGNLP